PQLRYLLRLLWLLQLLRCLLRRPCRINKAPLAVVLLAFEVRVVGGKASALERRVFREAVDADDPVLGAFHEPPRRAGDRVRIDATQVALRRRIAFVEQ